MTSPTPDALRDDSTPQLVNRRNPDMHRPDDARASGAARTGRSARRKYWLDLALFGAWMIASMPGLTGLALHEWFSLGLIVALLIHVVMHWDWVVRQLTRVRVRPVNQVNRLVDLAMWGSAILVMVSGVAISSAALPWLGIDTRPSFMWTRLHALSTALFLITLAFHLLQHTAWIWNQTKSLLRIGGNR